MKLKILLLLIGIAVAAGAQQYWSSVGSKASRVEKISDKEMEEYDAANAAATRAVDRANHVLKEILRAHHVVECTSMTSAISAPCKPEYASIHGDWLVIDTF